MNTFGLTESVSSWYGMTVMAVIGGMSIYLFTLIILRALFFKRINVDTSQLLRQAQHALVGKDSKRFNELRSPLATDSPVKILIGAALTNFNLAQPELIELLRITRRRQKARLERGLASFGTLSTIAPFVGLLGTVLGIVESFYNVAHSGSAGANVVGSGVAAALWATAAGLCVAIPSVVAYNIFNNRVKAILLDLETAASEIVLLLKTSRRSAPHELEREAV